VAKLACHCGAVISLSQVPSSVEGTLLRDEDADRFLETAKRDIGAFLNAARDGRDRRSKWLRGYFSEQYAGDFIPDSEIVIDILFGHYITLRLDVCECQECGRLYVQRQRGENVHIPYSPDEPGYHAVLKSQPDEPT
jgi:hypothetical protein